MRKVKIEVLPELYYTRNMNAYYVISKSGIPYCTGRSGLWFTSGRDVDMIRTKDQVLKGIKMRYVYVKRY